MELPQLTVFIAAFAASLGSIHSSCITDGDSSGSNSVTIKSVSDAIIEYTLKQYKEMLKDPEIKTENIVTSPFSIWSALALTYLGSRGRSSAVLGNLLGVDGMNKTKVEENIKLFNAKVSSSTGSVFTVANKIAVEQALKLKSCIANDPFVSISRANFKHKSEEERMKLNKWIESRTNGLIEDLLPQGSINPQTVLALLNAVYFKGKWLDQFDNKQTREQAFSSVNGQSKVQMMRRTDFMNYGYDDNIGASYVDLPYVDDKYSMLAILPYENNPGIDSVIEKITPTTLQSIWSSLNGGEVDLEFPRFELTKSYSLKKVLSSIGASSIFRSINLSGLIDSVIPTQISEVFHKVFVKVEEKGTEAAGATAVLIQSYSLFVPPKMSFNRPFAFILREKSTNAVLFMGVIRSL